MIKNIRLSIYIIVIIFFVGHSLQKIRADYAPEKMGLDDEARQEMRLEPRSFIPHPRTNRAEVSINEKTKTLITHKDELDEKHNESSGHEDEEEVVKDDEGSSTGSGEESISLSSHKEASAQKQRNFLSVASLADEHMKSFSASPVVFHSPENNSTSSKNENQSTPLVTPHLINLSVNTSSQNKTRAEDKVLANTLSEENKKAENESQLGEDEVEDAKYDKEKNGVAQQESSAVASMDEEPKKDSGLNKDDVGDALKLGLKSAKPQTKDESDAEEDRDDDDGNESGSGIDGEETKSSKLYGEEKDKKPENKNAETKDRENIEHSDENDKKMKDDNSENDDDDDDDDDDSVDKEDDHVDNISGSGDVPTKQTLTDSTSNVSSTTPTNQGSLNKDANNIDKTTEKDDDEGEDDDDASEKQEKMEDAINKESEEVDEDEDEDEDEEDKSQIVIKEPKELEPGKTTEANQQTFQQSTVHKLPNSNVTSIQNSSKESPLQTPQQQIHQLSTIHKVKNVQKHENNTQKTRKISVQHARVHSAVHTEKNVQNSEEKPRKLKPDKQVKVVKATHQKHDVNLKHHEAKHNDKKHKNPRKSKTLLKYIHRPKLHNKKRTGAKLNKPSTHKCNSDNIKTGYSLKGGTRAGHVEDLGGSAGMHECIQRCCHKKVCDVALMLDGRCFGVACYSKESCKPVMVPHPHYVNSQIAFLDRAQKRDDVGGARPEFDCKYGELTIRNNHRWSGELCGGVITCRNGIATVEKCPGVPAKPTDCANPKLVVQQRPGQCCVKKWICKDKSCDFGGRRISHGVSLSDQLCTGVVKCMNGHLQIKECPKLPEKPTSCAHPKLKITTVPGQCCKKRWVCPDKSCSYGELKVDDGERLTDASCAVVMECKNGFLNFKQCPSPPPVPSACLNPTLKVKRILGECCHMKWACAQETK